MPFGIFHPIDKEKRLVGKILVKNGCGSIGEHVPSVMGFFEVDLVSKIVTGLSSHEESLSKIRASGVDCFAEGIAVPDSWQEEFRPRREFLS
jgi:hypothetical protein